MLLVEDDPTIAEPLREGLEREGFAVDTAGTGAAALSARPADLVLLDLGLPDLDGRAVCLDLRLRTKVPIIVVSARGEEMDRVTLLELGADDYVVKPFGFRELVARMRAVSRRVSVHATAETTPIRVGPLLIDRRARMVTFDHRVVSLTPREYELLVYFARDPGVVKSREQLMHDVWDSNWWGPTKTLDVHVGALRRKVHPDLIDTVRSVGYRLNDLAPTA